MLVYQRVDGILSNITFFQNQGRILRVVDLALNILNQSQTLEANI